MLFLVRFELLRGHLWEKAALSVDIVRFSFEGCILVLTASVPGLCSLKLVNYTRHVPNITIVATDRNGNRNKIGLSTLP